MTGGEPLCNTAALSVGSRRLPRTSRRPAVLWPSYPSRTEQTRRLEPRAGVTSGSRLFTTRFGRSSLFDQTYWVPETQAKAAPLQANSLNSLNS